jgi:hypothetical protein
MLHRGKIVVFMMLLCLSTAVHATDMVFPTPDIVPNEVVAIQLNGLQYNDMPDADSGIRQTWAFAHPRNRAVTGPLPRFATMLKGPSFDMLLNHVSHKIMLAKSDEGWRQFDVFMEAANGDVMQFVWVVEKVTEGRYEDCWMTVAVSAPLMTGQGS